MLLADVISPVKVNAAKSTIDGLTSRSLLAGQLLDKSVDKSLEVVSIESSEAVTETVRLSMATTHSVSVNGLPSQTIDLSAGMSVQPEPTELALTFSDNAVDSSIQFEPTELALTFSDKAVDSSVQLESAELVQTISEKTADSPVQSEPIEIAQNTSDTFSPLTDEEIRQQLLIDPTAGIDFDAPRAVPSSTFLTPSAYGADWGDAFVGLAGATAGNRSDLDGSASLGVGFGDAVDNIGVEVSVGIISLDGFAEDGIVGFKLHKVFPDANNLAVALGWSNPIKWGAAESAEDTFYGVATHQFALRPNRPNTMPLTVSLGVGTGTFSSSGAIAAGDNSPNVFGSVGLRVVPKVSLISSWTGSGLGLAASAAPLDIPLVFTAGVSDVTDNTLEGARFHGAMGYSFSF